MFTYKMLEEINAIYNNLITFYGSSIDTKKPQESIGGTFYGSSELFSIRSAMFKKDTHYVKNYYGGINKMYDVVIKVGSLNHEEFKHIEKDFLNDFFSNMNDLLLMNGFKLKNESLSYKSYTKEIDDTIYTITLNGELSYGTNYSIYTACCFSYDKDNKTYHLNEKELKEIFNN